MRRNAERLLARRPILRRIAGYSAGSVIAAATSELAFVVTLGWLHGGTTWASAAGFVGGAVPNYILNRRWAWNGQRGRSLREEVALYALVALASFGASAVVTRWADHAARSATSDHGWTVALTALAFLGVSALFFVAKFLLYEKLVFIAPGRSRGRRRPGEAIGGR